MCKCNPNNPDEQCEQCSEHREHIGANTVAGKNGGRLMPPWKPGQSGNPSGRPKSVKDIQKKIAEVGEQLVDVLLDIAANEKAKDSDRIAAIKELNDRGFGKPSQDITVGQRRSIDDLSDEELLELGGSMDVKQLPLQNNSDDRPSQPDSPSEGEGQGGTGIQGTSPPKAD